MYWALIFVALAASAFAARYGLPDPLRNGDGPPVTAQAWRRTRREEILDLFRGNVYGRSPSRPVQERFKVAEEDRNALGGQVIRREVDIQISRDQTEFPIRVTLFLPKTAGPHPLFLLLNHRGTVASQTDQPFFPVKSIVRRGYAAAAVALNDIAPDDMTKYRNGILSFFDGPNESASDRWRTIAAWAWAGERAMDYLETAKDIDSRHVAVVGHSRGGKAALWCGAQDTRFSLTVSNESGETGAALARRREGERIADINSHFPHWFAQKYKLFNGHEEALPIDQHELIALIAPRLVYVASAEEDSWSDPLGEFLSCVHATPVFRLLGVEGITQVTQPPIDTPVQGGHIGYHVRKGGHNLLLYDWDQFMKFADRHWERSGF